MTHPLLHVSCVEEKEPGREKPCGSPACPSSLSSGSRPFISIVAELLEQRASTHFTRHKGVPLAASRWRSLFLHTALYAPLTSKLKRLTTSCSATPWKCVHGRNSRACSADFSRAPKRLVGNSPGVSTANDVLSAMTAFSSFPSVDSSEIGLHAFARV